MQDLNQKEYSNFILTGLLQRFPQFLDFFKYKNDIAIINYPSNSSSVILRISTDGNELTVGFAHNNISFSWHIHMDQLGASTPHEELKIAMEILHDIFIGNKSILYNNALGFYIDYFDMGDSERMDIKSYKWHEL